MLLHKVSKDRFDPLLHDQMFQAKLVELKSERSKYYSQDRWFSLLAFLGSAHEMEKIVRPERKVSGWILRGCLETPIFEFTL